MTYLWQHFDWPNFYFDESKIDLSLLYEYSRSINKLSLELEQVSEDLRLDAMIDLMVKEAITTSAIEGENLSYKDVRSSVKNHLGLIYPADHIRDPRAEGISALMVNNFQKVPTELSANILFQWHRMVLPKEYDTWGRKLLVGKWRESSIEVVSGPVHKQKVHFVGPSVESVAIEMEQFFKWYNSTSPQQTEQKQKIIPGPIRAAIAHLWFVTIHPFDDGNGRIARAIADHALAQDTQMPMLHSLSAAIQKHRNDYYTQLETIQSGSMDVTEWVQWFLNITKESIDITQKIITFTIEKSNFIGRFKDQINDRQLIVVLDLFANGPEGDSRSVNRNKYVKKTHCSPRTALRDINGLVEKKALKRLPGEGRNTRYGLNLEEL